MGKTKFGTKIVFVFVILLGAGAVLYAKKLHGTDCGICGKPDRQ